jgi:hypothetical protein
VLKLGNFGKQIRNTCKILKCGAGERLRRSVSVKNEVLQSVKEERNVVSK